MLRATQEPLDDGRQIEDPRLRRLLALWHAAEPRPGTGLLTSEALHVLGDILTIIDVEWPQDGSPARPGPRFRYRRCAAQIVERLGIDLTGTYVDAHPDPAARERVTALFESIVREPRPYHTVLLRMLGRGLWGTESLALPLFDAGGRVVTIVSGQVLPDDPLGALDAAPANAAAAPAPAAPPSAFVTPAAVGAAGIGVPPARKALAAFTPHSAHDPALSADQLDDPRLRDLLTLWEHEGPQPGLVMIDPINLRFLLGNIVVFVVEPEPLRFRYRLFGTNIVQRIGFDMTGRYADELPEPTTRRNVCTFLEKIWRERRAYRARSHRLINDEPWLTEALGLPLFDEAGAITAILAGQVHAPATAGWLSDPEEKPASD